MSIDGVVYEDHTCRIETGSQPPGLRLCGSIDIGAWSALDEALTTAVREGGDLRIDLSGLEAIDVRGMRTLMDAAAILDLDGWQLILLQPNPTVQHRIRICQETGPRNVQISDL